MEQRYNIRSCKLSRQWRLCSWQNQLGKLYKRIRITHTLSYIGINLVLFNKHQSLMGKRHRRPGNSNNIQPNKIKLSLKNYMKGRIFHNLCMYYCYPQAFNLNKNKSIAIIIKYRVESQGETFGVTGICDTGTCSANSI